ncbi:hypothetical protein FBEOM_12693 [Fusarium beomiforme]|uniref:Nephrocystin 3-like N-terminal domain-containing protein n=1 Tax=Fusarium beomiforme TaxID=44412 RepID=A0A9P5A739_9HYPO|nr:hypothetical protein FBEOM_12693 [Fusarium beomiforme]
MDSQHPIQPRSPAVDFAETKLSEYHEGFKYPASKFDQTLHRFVDNSSPTAVQIYGPRPLSNVVFEPPPRQLPPKVESMEFWGKVLPEAMRRLRECPKAHNQSQSEYGIRDLNKWSEVQKTLLFAKNSYDFRTHEGSIGQAAGKLRRATRKVFDKSVVPLQQAVKFVPDVEIASPIVGSVKVLLEAYRTVVKVRDDVEARFENLPETFADVDFYITRFLNDRNIISAAENLVLAILKATEYAIGFYAGYQLVRAVQAASKGDSYQQKLVDCLDEIKNCKASLDNEGRKSESFYTQTSQQRDRVEGHIMLRAINSMYILLDQSHQEFLRVSGEQRQLLTILRANTPQPSPYPVYKAEDIWRILDIPTLDELDIKCVLRRAGGILPEDRGRAEDIVDLRHFQQWVLNKEATTLLTHGDFDAAHAISPLSVLCVSLTQAMRARSGCISLLFVCGQHLSNDEFSGPATMIRSLTAQLLQQYPMCPKDLDGQVSIHGLREGNIQQLCRLFSCLARQVPPSFTIFCMIDGIQFYERESYIHDMMYILNSMYELASPTVTTEVRQLFPSSCVLAMAGHPRSERMASQQRLNRQLGGVLM